MTTRHEQTPDTPKDFSPDSYPGMSVGGVVQALQRQVARLTEENSQLRHDAKFDRLTGLQNKPTWEKDIDDRIEEAATAEDPKAFGIALADLDQFKVLNDTHGHPVGDIVLKELGAYVDNNLKRKKEGKADLVAARWGGDEFGFIFGGLGENDKRETDLQTAMDNELAFVDRILRSFVDYQKSKYPDLENFDYSIGSAVFDPAHPVDASTLIAQADEALYEYKHTPPQER